MTTTDRSLSDAINRLPRALKDAGFRGEVTVP